MEFFPVRKMYLLGPRTENEMPLRGNSLRSESNIQTMCQLAPVSWHSAECTLFQVTGTDLENLFSCLGFVAVHWSPAASLVLVYFTIKGEVELSPPLTSYCSLPQYPVNGFRVSMATIQSAVTNGNTVHVESDAHVSSSALSGIFRGVLACGFYQLIIHQLSINNPQGRLIQVETSLNASKFVFKWWA